MIDSFADALYDHLKAEIPTLLALQSEPSDALFRMQKECEAAGFKQANVSPPHSTKHTSYSRAWTGRAVPKLTSCRTLRSRSFWASLIAHLKTVPMSSPQCPALHAILFTIGMPANMHQSGDFCPAICGVCLDHCSSFLRNGVFVLVCAQSALLSSCNYDHHSALRHILVNHTLQMQGARPKGESFDF
jgi:hypothetical protein